MAAGVGEPTPKASIMNPNWLTVEYATHTLEICTSPWPIVRGEQGSAGLR